MSGRIYELPVHPGPFPWTQVLPSDSEANGSFGFTHRALAENYTGDSRILPAVTALTGGGTALDGVVTASGAVTTGAVREVLIGRQIYRYQLVNGTDLESVPEVIRPDDYNGGSNNRVWRLLLPVNRTAVGGVPGIAGVAAVTTTGLNLGSDVFSAWSRCYVNPGSVGDLVALLQIGSASGSVRLEVEVNTGALKLSLYDGSNVLTHSGTFADFRKRFDDSVVDTVLVRRVAANPANHEFVVFVNAEELITVTVPAAWSVTSSWFYGLQASRQENICYRGVLYNRSLSVAEVFRLSIYGLDLADRWASPAVTYAADFSAGTDTWTATGGGTLEGNVDAVGVPNLDNVLRYTVPASPGATQQLQFNFSNYASRMRRFRVRAKIWLPDSNTGADQVVLTSGLAGIAPVVLTGRTAGWVDVDVIVIYRHFTAGTLYLQMGFSAGSGTQVAGDQLLVASFSVQPVGALADLDTTAGLGRRILDRSSNGYSATMSSSAEHVMAAISGQRTEVVTLNHGSISALAGMTSVLRLPANCALLRVELERLTALDSGITLALGTSGDDDRHVAATAADTLGVGLPAVLVQTVESTTAETNIYLKKSGSTTVGQVRLRLTYEMRGIPGAAA